MDLKFHMDLYTRILKEHYENITYKESRGRINITYGPVGYLCTPKNEDELRYAICDILEIVSKLHREEVVHRDIRWDNVVKLTNGKWLLIDFEEAARIGDERYSSNANRTV
uniref:Protein kinase domain-containing protein n=1 Tax=Rhizophagus irregularis (strain DAOM 181602 / DAOM 197198 / MUCL 43194) TaxID=747089 RepID=U9U0L8_RHIID